MVNIIVRQYKNKKAFAKNAKAKIAGEKCCRGRDRTSTGQLVVAQSSVVDPGRPDFHRNGSMLYLSCFPHPRDKRACLPCFRNFITPQYCYKSLMEQI